MTDDNLTRIFAMQSGVCASFGSAFYADLMARAGEDLTAPVRALFAPWRGQSYQQLVEAAVSLRFLGALHDLALTGENAALTAAFPPTGDAGAAWAAARAAIDADPERFSSFMGHEPQTNEVRRSACLLPGFLTVAAETGLPLACFELGASAGLNQLWRRFHYDYGAAGAWGNPASPVRLPADWSGPASVLKGELSLSSIAACDRRPIDLADPIQLRRLRAYLWPDQTERLARFDAAVAMARTTAMKVETADAVAWTEARCAPQPGVATVIFHSIFQQYLPPATAAALKAAIARHGASATRAAPLAWLRMEPLDGQPVPIELRLTLWPGGEDWRLAVVQAHGAWVAWGA